MLTSGTKKQIYNQMAISKETIAEFQKAAKKEMGKELTYDEAEEVLRTWVNYYDLLAKLYHQDKEAIDSRTIADMPEK